MIFKSNKYRGTSQSLNAIPLIDILFQLLVFFALIYKIAEAENLEIKVPDNCGFAQKQVQVQPGSVTVTLLKNQKGQTEFAVGSEIIPATDYNILPQKLSELIDSRFKDVPSTQRLVTLRIDKDIQYSKAQYALAAIAQSSASEIKLAVQKD